MGVGSDEHRQAMGWGSGAAIVPIESKAEDASGKAGVAIHAPPALPRRGGTTWPGVIPTTPAGMASAR
jgi:hypothetical protein